MYAQNPMFSGVSPGRMAEARRFAQGGQMGRARQQFELGGGQWNPQVQGMIGQQDNIGQMIPGPGRPPMPPSEVDRWNPGGPPPGRPGWGFGGGMRQPGFEPGGPDDPEMGGSGYMTRPGMGGGMGGPPQWGAFPGMGGGMGRPPMPPPQFQGRPPAGGGFWNQLGPWGPQGGMGGRPPAGPPGLRRMVQY